MSFFDRAISAGIRSVRSVAGMQVRYTRGSNWVSVCAVRGSSLFNATGDDVIVEAQTFDYLIDVCDLVLNGVSITPKKGDTITDDDHVYEVSPPTGSDVSYRYSDHGRTQFRVHTRRN